MKKFDLESGRKVCMTGLDFRTLVEECGGPSYFLPDEAFNLGLVEFRLYSHYLCKCSMYGSCWETVEESARKCRVKPKEAEKAKAELMKPQDWFGNKPMIREEVRVDRYGNKAVHTIVNEIIEDNDSVCVVGG